MELARGYLIAVAIVTLISETRRLLRRWETWAIVLAFLALFMLTANAQVTNNENTFSTPGGQIVGSVVYECLNTSGKAVPCQNAAAAGASGFPLGAIPIAATFSGADTTSATATLTGAANLTTYICTATVSGLGATAIGNVTVTVGPLVGPTTLNYTYSMPAGATVPAVTLNITYTPCMPASAPNTSIVVTVPGAAGNTATTISATGFRD